MMGIGDMLINTTDKLLGKKTEKRTDDTLISEMIRYVADEKDELGVLNRLLEFVGRTLNAERSYIFEENSNGTFNNTYEWTKEGVNPEIDNLQNVPFVGVVDKWYESFLKDGCVIVKDIEEYKSVNKDIYDILSAQDIKTLIAGPIELNGEFCGFFGIDNPPVDEIDNISFAMESVEFVISLIMRVKAQNEILVNSSITDQLTGCGNRKALNWAYEGKYDHSMPIAVVMCDINGLKLKNDTEGHEAGDKYIYKASEILRACYGRKAIYRIGGDEFVAVVLGDSEGKVKERTVLFTSLCEENKISMSIGYVHKQSTDMSFDELLKEADKKMYIAKREFYRKKGVDRREESQVDRMNEYVDALVDYGTSCIMAWKVNLTEDTFEVIHVMKGYDSTYISECKSASELFMYPVNVGAIYEDDVNDFKKYVNLDFIKTVALNSNGKSDYWTRFRSKFNSNEYRLIEFQTYAAREYTNENQIVYVLIKNMGVPFSESRLLFEEVLRELSESFESVFYVDFDKNEVVSYRLGETIRKKMGDALGGHITYEQAVEGYLKVSVVESEKKTVENIFSRQNLEKQLSKKRAFSHDYRVINDGEEQFFRVQFSNMDGAGELHHCVIGFANVTQEMRVKRELANTGNSLLVVEENEINREILKALLEDSYSLYEACNGFEALKVLEEHFADIALVVTDLEMPKLNGYELISKMQTDERFAHIPVIVTTAYGDDDNKIRCLELGASDFVSKPYNGKVMRNRIKSLIRLRGLSTTIDSIEHDGLTGLYTREAFYRYAQSMIDKNPDKDFTIVLSDIVGFKAINEQYGKETGDAVLKYLASTGPGNEAGFILGGRLAADVFACIKPDVELSVEDEKRIVEEVQNNAPVPALTLKYGMYHTRMNRNLTVQQMCDRASLALASIKRTYGVISAPYDESMGQKLMTEQQIISSMEQALKGNQFKVFFQPKHDIISGKMDGAEALVRWIHPEIGFMNPGVFIPLFERNGFIARLDEYVWEKTCDEISYWIERGIPFPISVNVSRRDFEKNDLAKRIIGLTDKKKIPHELLHIEITESAYSDNPEQIKEAISTLHKAGFVIELDDFGTGYSSIAALSSLEVDILKFDMSIIRNDNSDTGKSVLEFSMQLAKMMKLKTIQEGVETEQQLERMKQLGCDYVQGYYYSKPLPESEFIAYVEDVLKK